jgi:hypothetical protein
MNTILNNKHYFYLLLAIIGGGMTFYYTLLGIQAHNGHFDSMEFIKSTWIDNYYAKSLTLDFWTGAVAGTFFMIVEGVRLKMKRIWLYPILTVFVAFAFGFPLFLFMRALKMKEI